MAKKEEESQIPDWVMALVGISLAAWLINTFKIMEIMNIFFMVFVVPCLLIMSISMGGMGMYNVVSRNWNNGVNQVREKVAEKMAKAKAA